MRALLLFLPLAFTLLTVPACHKQGPMEKAGENIDEAIDDAADQVEEVQEDMKRNN